MSLSTLYYENLIEGADDEMGEDKESYKQELENIIVRCQASFLPYTFAGQYKI